MPFKPVLVTTLLAAAFATAGCDRKPTDPMQPKALSSQTTVDAPVPPPPVADPSLPSASAALNAPATVASAPSASFNTEPMSRPAESAAMPLGGQNNDHSTPKPYEPGGSSPASAVQR